MTVESWTPKKNKRPAEVAKKRVAEQSRRYAIASYRAYSMLAKKHPVEYAALLENERRNIDAERGALPGDSIAD